MVLALTGALMVALTACSALGLVSPDSFSERLAAGYTAVTTVRSGTLTLLTAHEVSPQSAQKAQDKADQARGLLDLAARLKESVSASSGQSKLDLAVAVLGDIQKCVDIKTGFDKCIDDVSVEDPQ